MGTFSLLTLNCFGAPAPSTARRLRALAALLERSAYDVVCLQEVQLNAYRRLLTAATPGFRSEAFAPHLHAPRGGLLTLSRPLIVGSRFIPYRDRDIPSAPAVMDWLLSKGVLLTEVHCGQLSVVVLNTHLNANYSGDWAPQNRYAQVERRQLAQLAAVVAEQPADALVVACGDLNIPRGSWLYDALLAEAGLTDPLAGDSRPTYRVMRGLPGRYSQPIDFALTRAPALPGLSLSADLRFAEPMPVQGGPPLYLSDHAGVELCVSWEAPAAEPGDGAQPHRPGCRCPACAGEPVSSGP
jgi:endonuclease/exonuclease/phosphatase family metal-dependent hydrolase